MEIISSDDSIVTEPVKRDDAIFFEEAFVTEPLDPDEISDKYWDIFELIKQVVPEKSPVQAREIALRIENHNLNQVSRCLKSMWRAGLIRLFLRVPYRKRKADRKNSPRWYLVHNVKEYVLPKVERKINPRGAHFKHVPAEVIAQIRRYGPEMTNEDIARKHELSIWYVERIKGYKVRRGILP